MSLAIQSIKKGHIPSQRRIEFPSDISPGPPTRINQMFVRKKGTAKFKAVGFKNLLLEVLKIHSEGAHLVVDQFGNHHELTETIQI